MAKGAERVARHVYGKDTPAYRAIMEKVRKVANSIYYEEEAAAKAAYEESSDRVALYEMMVIKCNYYSEAKLEELAQLSAATDRTEEGLLQEALDDVLHKYRESL